MYGKMGGKATVSVCKKIGRRYMGGVRKFLDRLLRIDNPFWTPNGPKPFTGISGYHFGQESTHKSRSTFLGMIHYTNYCTVVLLLVSYRM